jgi:uncharacterized protein YkwD
MSPTRRAITRTHPPQRGRAVRAAALLTLSAAAFAGCDTSTVEPELDSEIQAFVGLVNDHREATGCPRLIWNGEVAEVARVHSQDMVDRDFFAHTNPDGASPADRLRNAGIDYRRMAENIAHGYGTGAAVLEGWLGSSGHRAAIENCELLEHGVAVVGSHWTHLFVTL